MDADTRKELRDYAWRYFSLHADQRLRTFNFFLALVTILAGGLFAILREGDTPILAAPLAGALVFSSFIFWMVDERNHDLLKGSEDALKILEDMEDDLPDDGCGPNRLKLFRREEYVTGLRKTYARVVPYFTYHRSFRWVFAVVAASGVILLVVLPIASLR